MITKSIDWSYPTSINAERFGFAGFGCFTVSLNVPTARGSATAEAVAGFDNRRQAVDHARGLSEPWAQYHLRRFPADTEALS